MVKTPVWKSIVGALKTELAQGHYAAGEKLPTEARLAARFGVNRHTVRHALSAMAAEGLVRSRRGAGVFVSQIPTDYPIGKRVRFHQNLTAAGRVPAKKILSLETRNVNLREQEALALEDCAQVHVYEGLSLSDGQPIGLFRSVFPEERFPDLLERFRETSSVTAALMLVGIADYTRASTAFTAKRATVTQALHLQIKEGAPILRTVGVNADLAGRPIEFGRAWFAGDRVTLTVADQ